MRSAVALLFVVVASGCQEPIPPRPEALVVVTTDLPVRDLSARLRIDIYDDEGRWRTSRDLVRLDPADWPVSFSVYTDAGATRAWLRLRVYPEGGTRRYEGERFTEVGGAFVAPVPPPTALRLIEGERDVTPELEPHPLVTVDRVVGVALEPERRGRVVVALHADCAGTMAQVPTDRGPDATSATCVDTWGQRRAPSVAVVEADVLERTAPELPALAIACEGSNDERACIEGGAVVLGSREVVLTPGLPATPERLFQLSTFWLDRDEVTVGRYRAAQAAGYLPVAPVVPNEGELSSAVDATACSWSSTDRGREAYPLSCVSWDEARAFCQHAGGDLPTEAQWERAARRGVAVGRSRYPWGQDAPTCARTVHGRWPLGGSPGVCEAFGRRPEPIRAAPGDVTLDGVHDLAGSMQEWTRDGYFAYDGDAWGAAGPRDPTVAAPVVGQQAVRGASWPAPPTLLNSAVRTGVEPSGRAPFIGFRCAYPEPPP
ncbi:MAG: SUMF1/EgtB/PvdO family nonheme iron enzyme [Myxococcota bacterium]